MTVTLESTKHEFAVERLYERRYRAFCRMATTVTGDSDTARDAVQDGFARALENAAQYRGEGSLDAWVWRIVLRAALDRSRERRRLRSLETVGPFEAWMPELPHAERDPALAAALQRLSPRQRLVVFLRYFVDLSHAEIAEFTGIRLGTVSATLAQAKAVLSRRLDPRRSTPRERTAAHD